MTKKEKCRLIEGGWIGDDKQQNFAIVKYDIHRKVEHHFNFKGIGKYEKHNEKELHKLTDFINNCGYKAELKKFPADCDCRYSEVTINRR